MKKILLTGFEPFRNEPINPSQELARAFAKTCDTLVLPVSYDRAWKILRAQLAERDYDFILMLGQAGDRKNICLERVAINLQDTETPDEDGIVRVQSKISEAGPDAFMNPLSLRALSQALQRLKLPVEVSFTAGAFVCNSIYYQSFLFLKESGRQTPVLFVHVPYLPEQTLGKAEGTPSLSLDLMRETISALLGLVSA
jgi:pyroglutamyl-peptidase